MSITAAEGLPVYWIETETQDYIYYDRHITIDRLQYCDGDGPLKTGQNVLVAVHWDSKHEAVKNQSGETAYGFMVNADLHDWEDYEKESWMVGYEEVADYISDTNAKPEEILADLVNEDYSLKNFFLDVRQHYESKEDSDPENCQFHREHMETVDYRDEYSGWNEED